MSTVMEAQPLVVRDRRATSIEEPAAQPVATVPPGDLNQETVLLQVIARGAADKTVDLDRMERLLVMQERLAARRAESQFIDAMARFKQNAPKIAKDKQVRFATSKGTTEYRHATLGAVCQAAIAGLADVGISHRWDLEQQQGGRIVVTCVLTHTGGHSTRTALSGSPDDSGNKNNIQQVASTITYLERYTLLAATGLATDEQDDDGRTAGAPPTPPNPIPDDVQVALREAADLGTQELRTVWGGLTDGTRTLITKGHAKWWDDLKAKAREVQS